MTPEEKKEHDLVKEKKKKHAVAQNFINNQFGFVKKARGTLIRLKVSISGISDLKRIQESEKDFFYPQLLYGAEHYQNELQKLLKITEEIADELSEKLGKSR